MRRIVPAVALALTAFLALALVAWLLTGRGDRFEGGPRNPMAVLAGRVLMVGFEGRDPSDPEVRRTLGRLERGEIAGVMFLRRNVSSQAQVKTLARRLRAAARPAPLVALDQEGGRVVRLGWRSGFPSVRAPLAIANAMTPEDARRTYGTMAGTLRDWGFNVNFGPVVDLHRADNPIIGRLARSFGADPDVVIAYARAFLAAHEAAGVATAVKHFPGHGSSLADTHLGSVDVTESWSPRELRPFAALVAEAPMVMTGHIVNRRLGAPGPATLSRAVVTDLLRGRLGFDGVVVSDDLQMDAIADLHSQARAAELALRAGVDLLLFGNAERADPQLVVRVSDHLAALARRDGAFAERLREAGDRVDRLRTALDAWKTPSQ